MWPNLPSRCTHCARLTGLSHTSLRALALAAPPVWVSALPRYGHGSHLIQVSAQLSPELNQLTPPLCLTCIYL